MTRTPSRDAQWSRPVRRAPDRPGSVVRRSSPGRPCRERTRYVLRLDTFESLLRQIVREEVRAALLDMGAGPDGAAPPTVPAPNPLALTTEDVAEMTGVAVQTLYNWRSQTLPGKPVGPRSFKIGRLVRYTEADVNAWLDGLHSK
jgi:predicted DNA-binding transcriptional regulator AlpA